MPRMWTHFTLFPRPLTVWLSLLLGGSSLMWAGCKECVEDANCEDGVCIEGSCEGGGREGDPCRSDGSCDDSIILTYNGEPYAAVCDPDSQRCVMPGQAGHPCLRSGECAGLDLVCDPDTQQCRHGGTGQSCEKHEQCADGFCAPSKHTCGKVDDGEACESDEWCREGYCNQATARCGRGSLGDPCLEDDPKSCTANAFCREVCIETHSKADGESCLEDVECESRMCTKGVCTRSRFGEACGTCVEGLLCTAGKCLYDAGNPCTSPGECGFNLTCAQALDGEQRCVDDGGWGHQCASDPRTGDFFDVCAEEACRRECARCEAVLEVSGYNAYCLAPE